MANWLYNGVELPPLPEWDKNTFPYATISYNSYTSGYELVLTSVRTVTDGTAYGGETSDGYQQPYSINSVGEWEAARVYPYDSLVMHDKFPILWTNEDIIDTRDGSVYLAASTPIGAPKDEPAEGVSMGKKYLLYRMFPPHIAKVLSER